MKLHIKFTYVLPIILSLFLSSSCKDKPARTFKLPGYIISEDFYKNIPLESQRKISAFSQKMDIGEEPSFENVSAIFPKMQYPPTLVGVKEHMGKYLVNWDGGIVCSPVYISFEVGNDSIPFGRVREKNVSRSLLDGYLPVVTTNYTLDGINYEQTVFGYSKELSTENLQISFVRMKIRNSTENKKDTKLSVYLRQVEEEIKDIPFKEKLTLKGNGIQNENRNIIFWAEQNGGAFQNDKLTYDLSLNRLEEKELYFRFPHLPVTQDNADILELTTFQEALKEVKVFWRNLVERGMQVNVPEEIVEKAYKTWLINNFLLVEEDKSREYFEVHDAPFVYERVYGFASAMYMYTLTTRGYFEEAKKVADLLIKLQRPNGGFSGVKAFIPHQNGSILYAISQLYRKTNDAKWFKTVVPNIIAACDMILQDRALSQELIDGEKLVSYGLLSKYKYCEDEVGGSTLSREYLANAWCWAGLNQASIAIGELGDEYQNESLRLRKAADDFRSDIFASMEKAMIKVDSLNFLPMVVDNTEPFNNLHESRLSLYYNILAPRMLESEIFDIDDEKIDWVPNFLEQRDGLVLGLARFQTEPYGDIDPHFIAGYAITNLRRDKIDKFLLSYYGLLSYGMARETFSTQECSYIVDGTADYFKENGEKHWSASRQPHLHSSSELIRLTNMMLIKEEKAEIWLTHGVPRAWLEDGKVIEVKKAQTSYGQFNFSIKSQVSQGFIKTNISAPNSKQPTVIRLKLRHPEGKQIKKVELNGKAWNNFGGEVVNIHDQITEISVVAYY
ncbi:hypothetical protein KO529_04840 [Arenibacter algicola]|uniref:hypothetical protein n=1 Tax=Arenibacter algicola TaxID=616991 RepID=UPI001C079436|nr:hypothetical protein [Arenibacter algicola]MBU2904102.1 hypothetical protein [Arenibacter algicola]